MKHRKMRQQRTVPFKAQLVLVALAFAVYFLSGCSSAPPKPQGYILPPAMSEVFRNGQLTPLQHADTPELGMPNPHDLVSHTCVSTPMFHMDGTYYRTDVQCW